MVARIRIGAACAALGALVACTTAPPPPPPPVASSPPPAAPPPPDLPPVSWQDRGLAPGDWRYVDSPNSRASYGSGDTLFAIECTGDRRIRFVRPRAAAAATIAIRTTSGERALPASAGAEGVSATLAATDPLLDEIAFSRGRILVQVEGQTDLVLPTWPEPARVIEDCRGQ